MWINSRNQTHDLGVESMFYVGFVFNNFAFQWNLLNRLEFRVCAMGVPLSDILITAVLSEYFNT